MGLFVAACGWVGQKVPLPKICYTYPTNMKFDTIIPYIKKNMIQPLRSADISVFSFGIRRFCYIKKYKYRLDFGT